MANKNKDYSIEDADETLEYFQKLSGLDPLTLSSTPANVYFRALLYKVLMEFNYMNDRQIEEFFKSKGVKRTRSAVYQAVNKIDMYYFNYSDFRNVYNVLFDDRMEEGFDNKTIDDQSDLIDVVEEVLPEREEDDLQTLIDSLPLSKRDEVYEIVSLRVKSWGWKSKDKCEVIQSSDGVTGTW